jgi:DNA-binding transcriptional LysR family regulator
MDVKFVAVAHVQHPLALVGRELVAEDLVHHVQAVVRDSGTQNPRDDGWLGAERRFTVSSLEASLATISAGLAYGWLPEHMLVAALREGTLRELPLVAGARRNVSLHIVLAQPDLLGPAARAAVESFHRHGKG